MDRREFVGLLGAAASAGIGRGAFAAEDGKRDAQSGGGWSGRAHPLAGKKLPPWSRGEFQVHFIYTGVCESMFWIMPDGTSMLLDCGDFPAWQRGKNALWVLPDGRRYAGEWIARYVERVNPAGRDVDYLMVSHHHDDHAGRDGWGAAERDWNGKKLSVGGILLAADTLKFKTGFDRGWPNFDEPIPNELCDRDAYPHIRKTIEYLAWRDGFQMRRFEVGAAGQVAQTHGADEAKDFSVVNIAGNGKILCRDGKVRDLYADMHGAKRLNENGMSLGLLVKYGPFRFYTAGDFSDVFKRPDGTKCNVEAELAKELDAVDVAKVNHHGHHSMPGPIVAALRARVWTSSMWDRKHVTADTLSRICDRSLYPEPRLVAPCVFPPVRRFEDAGRPFLRDIAPESFDAGHVVLTVAPGGANYTVAYVTADNESMRVTGAYGFESRLAQ